MINVNEIKKSAREHLRGKWKKVVLFVLCFILVEYIINKIFFSYRVNEDFKYNQINNILVKVFNISQTTADKLNYERNFITKIAINIASSEGLNFQLPSYINFIGLILFILKIIVEVPLLYAFNISLMKLKRGNDISKFSFIENDNLQFKRAWKVELKRISVLIVPIIILLIISINTAMNYIKMIKYRHYLMCSESATSLYDKKFIINIVLLIVCYIYYYTQKLKYVLSFKIALDEPELRAKEVIEKSKSLMIGHRKEYFILQLSFIGWKILAYFTLGIGYLWLIPYIQISTICFYDKLRENIVKDSINNIS